jgi:oligosaccharide translocation protein RFT1
MDDAKTVKAAAGVLYAFLLRMLSFALSQLTIRFVDPTSLGKASIRLELICNTTVLFLGREGFRLGLMKVAYSRETGDHRKVQRINNVAWLCIPVSLCFTLIALIFHLHTYQRQVSSGNIDEMQDYKLAGILYCIASMIEILSEPCMIECLRSMDMKTRAKAEALASIARALVSVVSLSFSRKQYNAATFGAAQCIYATIMSGTLYVYKLDSLMWPQFTFAFDHSVLWLCTVFSLQSVFKHLLTDGDRIVLSAIAGAYDSGVYAMASAYCGMACRILFQPMEENGRILFSNCHSHIAAQVKKEKNGDIVKLVDELRKTYCVLIKFVVYIGLIFAIFGSNYTAILLNIMAGGQWGSNPDAAAALSAFCIYTAFMALNGMTEAFVYGVAETGIEIGSLTVAHAIFGFVFYAIAPILVIHGHKFGIGGTVGLVIANGICMVLRSCFSLQFAFSYFDSYRIDTGSRQTRAFKVKNLVRFVAEVLPRKFILIIFLFCFITMHHSRSIWMESRNLCLTSMATVQHIGCGIMCFAMTGGFVYALEKDFGRSLYAMISDRRRKDEKQKEE